MKREGNARQVLSVSDLNRYSRELLEAAFPSVWVEGEISNFSAPSSGHWYFTLKDSDAQVRCAMFRNRNLRARLRPANGDRVLVRGSVSLYTARGEYQLIAEELEAAGAGALQRAMELLRQRLAAEGLLAPERKRPLPRFPRGIGLITSPTGAAIRDLVSIISRRFPLTRIVVIPTIVQGEAGADSIVGSLKLANARDDLDVLIVGRGGGSLEDLWAFNEECVARAIFESRIPVISGVGHEVDVTISDLVADLRAPTPTAAAELACPVLDDVLDDLADGESRLRRAVRHALDHARRDLAAIERIEWFRDPCGHLRRAEQQLDELLSRLTYCCSRRLARYREQLHESRVRLAARQPSVRLQSEIQTLQREFRHFSRLIGHRLHMAVYGLQSLQTRLEASSYRQTLARGFSITRTRRGRRIITAPEQVRPGDLIVTETAGGEFESRVEDSRQPRLFD